MKQYFLLPLLLFFIAGCSLEVGNEYDDKRLPVDNKTYLSKQKRERLFARKDLNGDLLKTRRYKFSDSERPVLRGQDRPPVREVYENEFGCIEGEERSACEKKQAYYADYRTESRGEVEPTPYDNEHEKRGRKHRKLRKEHSPEGSYSSRRKEKTIRIKPLHQQHKAEQKKIVPVSHAVKSNASDHKHDQETQHPPQVTKTSMKKNIKSSHKIVHYEDNDGTDAHHDTPSSTHHSLDDEGVPTIPPKIATHDDMEHVANVQPIHDNTTEPPTTQKEVPSHNDTPSTDAQPTRSPSTVKEANENIANIRSQIEAKHMQDKQDVQHHVPIDKSSVLKSANDGDMNDKLSQLKKLTSQGNEIRRFTPKLPADNSQNTHNINTSQKKVSSQEVHLALDSNSEKNKAPVDAPVRAKMPPPVDL